MATLTKPSTPGWRSVAPRFRKVKARNVSPFTLQAQTYLYPGEQWSFDLSLPSMSTAQAGAWMTFLHQMAKSNDTFELVVTGYVPAGVTSPMTVRLAGNGNECNWDINTAKRFGLSFTVEQVIS